jgi:hypothetical protein
MNAISAHAWRWLAALAVLGLACFFSSPAHAAPPDSKQQHLTSSWKDQAGVSHADLAPADASPAAVAPESTVTACLVVSLSVQDNFPGGSVHVDLSFVNNCGQAVRNITWQLSSTHICGYAYSGGIAANGGLGTTAFNSGAGATLLSHTFPSACQWYNGQYMLYSMTTSAYVNGLFVSDTSHVAHGGKTEQGSYY